MIYYNILYYKYTKNLKYLLISSRGIADQRIQQYNWTQMEISGHV